MLAIKSIILDYKVLYIGLVCSWRLRASMALICGYPSLMYKSAKQHKGLAGMLVKQISNLFELIELFARVGKPLAVREIVEEFGWPRSSVFNIVATMVEHGYLYQPVPRGGYYPTTRWMELARELADSQPLPESVHELLESLAAQTGETLFLAIQEGVNVVFLDVVESTAEIRFIANIGQRLPIHVTAAGRAILSQFPAAERAALLSRIHYQAYEKETFMTPDSVEQDIVSGLGQGWFVNLGIYAPGVAGLAVPFTVEGRRAAIALGGPVSRIQPRVNELGQVVATAVAEYLGA